MNGDPLSSEPMSADDDLDNCLNNYLDINDLTPRKKLERAAALKDRGTKRFKEGLFREAHRDYHQAFKFVVAAAPPPDVSALTDVSDKKEEDAAVEAVGFAEINDLKCALYLNIAACLQKNEKDSNKEERIISCCSKVLLLDGSNVKAFYRRAKARADLGEWEEAQADLKTGLELEPENKALKSELAKTIRKEKEYNNVMARRMANMFVS